MKHKLISALILCLFVACSTGKQNIPGKLHYRNSVMYQQAKPLAITKEPYGFFLFADSSQAVFIPRSKKHPVMMYYRIDNDFIYIP